MPRPGQPRRTGSLAAAMTVVIVGAGVLMIMFAARTGPQRIIHGTLRDPSMAPYLASYSRPPINVPRGKGGDGAVHGGLATILQWGVQLLWFALIALAVGYLIVKARDAFQLRRRPQAPPPDVAFDVLDDPELLADELRRDADDQLALLRSGTPRNAIVACWDRFEERAELVGASRLPWETSSEFTLRILDVVSADDAAVRRLEALYREARFSDHVIDESRRESAVEALEAIQASLRVRVGR